MRYSTRSLALALDRTMDGNAYQDKSKCNEEGGERDRVLGGEKHDGCEIAMIVVDHLCFAKTDSGI